MARVGGSGRIVFGVTLVIVGVLFLFAQFGIYDFEDLSHYFWPVALIVFGLWQWANRRFRSCFWPPVLIAAGLFFLARQLGLLGGHSFGILAGVLLVGMGLWLIVRRPRARPEQAVSDADAVDHWVTFGSVEESLNTQRFSGGSATAVFGGIELDLRQAALASGEVPLNLSAFFGGVEIKVPEAWDVVVDGTGIFGGVEDKTGGKPGEKLQTGSQLRIRAVAVFGGIEISR